MKERNTFKPAICNSIPSNSTRPDIGVTTHKTDNVEDTVYAKSLHFIIDNLKNCKRQGWGKENYSPKT